MTQSNSKLHTVPVLRYATFLLAVFFVGALAFPLISSAQYFGRNKVQYDDFEFETFKTDHFEFFLYEEEEEAVGDAARMAERWYQRHSRTFLREFFERKPIIFYANDADFHQTNAIGGTLGEGTGGVTESLKERVIMPLTGSSKRRTTFSDTSWFTLFSTILRFLEPIQFDLLSSWFLSGSLKAWPNIFLWDASMPTQRCGCGMLPFEMTFRRSSKSHRI